MLVIHDLGELAAERDTELCDPGGAKPRTILAVLCAHAGHPVPATALITEVWGPDAPERTQRALESQIWRLRKSLSPNGEPSAIVTDRAGYRLDLTEVTVDSIAFETAAAAALDQSRITTVDALEHVLRRWRGEPFTTATSTPLLDQARRRLTTVRAALLTRRADLLLTAGDLDRALDEAQALITRDPLDEHAWTVKISALAAGGQRAEALTAYRDIRDLLATELGVEPGTEVRAAQRLVLDDHSRAVRHIRLPSQHTSFVGRDTELAEVIRLLESERAVSLTGIPGVGKTRLAIEAARRAADVFDDGVWYIPRRDDTDDATAILETMRIQPSAEFPTAIDQVCTHLSSMSALLVLDGRPSIDQQKPLGDNDIDTVLQRCAAVTVLCVGERSGVDGEHAVTVHPLPIESPGGDAPSPAQHLLIDRIRAATGHLEVGADERTDLDRICRAMGGLPLGLELAAARTATFSVGEVADQLGTAVPEPVTRAFTLAFDAMPEDQFDLFLRLTALRNPFTPALAAAVGDRPTIADDLAEFTRRSLLWPIRGNRRRPTRFTILRTVADHARSSAPDQAAAAVAARDTAVAALLAATPMGITSRSARDLARIDDDHSTVVAFLESVVTDPALLDDHIDLLERLGAYWYFRRRLADGIRLLRMAAATTADGACRPRTVALVDLTLGSVLAFSQLTDEAHRHLTVRSLDEVESIVVPDDRDPETHIVRLALASLAAWVGDDHALAGDYAARAATLLEGRTAAIEATVIAATALSEVIAGQFTEALDHAHTALALGTERGDPLATHLAAVMLGIAALFEGDSGMGLRWNDQAFRAYLDCGGVQICDTVEQRGNHLAAAGETERAGRAFAVSRRYAVDAGLDWPRNPFTHDSLKRGRETDPAQFEQGWRDGWTDATDALATSDHQRFSGM
ncbi:BTAD domain-containing putative transcriptional regulator [Gordonia sp. CPCC 205515]